MFGAYGGSRIGTYAQYAIRTCRFRFSHHLLLAIFSRVILLRVLK